MMVYYTSIHRWLAFGLLCFSLDVVSRGRTSMGSFGKHAMRLLALFALVLVYMNGVVIAVESMRSAGSRPLGVVRHFTNDTLCSIRGKGEKRNV